MKQLNRATLRRRILKHRRGLGWTQREFAEKARMSTAAACWIEGGSRAPSVTTLFRIAQVLGVSIDYLTGLTDRQYVSKRKKKK